VDEQGFAWLPEDDFVNHFAADVDPAMARVMHAVQQPLHWSALDEVMGVPAWKVRYDPSFYGGAAVHYRSGRPPYSPQLEGLLAEELGLDGGGRLLDVGCGPGVLTVRLARLFEDAVGLDPDPAMITEGGRAAEDRGLVNIAWIRPRAEELPAVAPGPYRLVTFGQSFCWTDEVPVAEAAYDMVEPGGALVLVGHQAEGRAVPPGPGPPRIPHDEIGELVRKYLGSRRRAGQSTAPVQALSLQDALSSSRFGASQVIFAPGSPDHVQNIEGVLSSYFSMSWAASHLFGGRVEEFAGEVREPLQERSPAGVFWNWPGDTEVMLARK
jgi:SAM-dependent methyltransferase